jgi:hypothetical protein
MVRDVFSAFSSSPTTEVIGSDKLVESFVALRWTRNDGYVTHAIENFGSTTTIIGNAASVLMMPLKSSARRVKRIARFVAAPCCNRGPMILNRTGLNSQRILERGRE